jgi:hypothetical protein
MLASKARAGSCKKGLYSMCNWGSECQSVVWLLIALLSNIQLSLIILCGRKLSSG